MASKSKDYTPPTRAELEAMRETKLQGAPVSEAVRREISFLRNVGGAGDDLEWILFNQAWTELGFENVGDWWEQRVLPVLVNVDIRPSAALAGRVMAAIAADEAGLPKLQRRTQRQIAALARTSQARVSRSLSDANESGSDLGKAAKPASSPLVEALRTEVESVEENQRKTAAAAAPRPADEVPQHPGTDHQGDTSADGPGAQTLEGEADRLGPSVTPETTGEPPLPGDEDDTGSAAGTSSDAQPPASGQGPDVGDETGAGPASVPVDVEGQQAHAGVSGPAVPSTEQPRELLEWFAGVWALVDYDVRGPMQTSDDMAAIGRSLDNIVNGVELLIRWHERGQT